MKVYIAGQMDQDDSMANFARMEDQLKAAGHDPVNPFNAGSYGSMSDEDRTIDQLKQILTCDAIFLLKWWNISKDARIAFLCAKEMDKKIMFQSKIEEERMINERNGRFADKVNAAIRNVLNCDFNQFEVENRSQDVVYTRMIFTQICHEHGMTLKEITKFTRRDYTTLLHYMNRYQDEYRFNPYFKKIADQIKEQMTNV